MPPDDEFATYGAQVKGPINHRRGRRPGGRTVFKSLTAKAAVFGLSDDEVDVMRMIAKDWEDFFIAERLGITLERVYLLRQRIKEKTGVAGNLSIARFVGKYGF